MFARVDGRAGRITLTRPAALNALDLPMIHAIAAALAAWRDDPDVHLVVIDAEGDRAFCAGGDIRAVRDLVLAGEHEAAVAFFAHEYALNRTIARYEKPYVALVDGICMGGGVGVSVHGAVRVVTEHAQFAMPETQIGFFPDVGASFILPRLRGLFGRYLGLTGSRVGGGDACWLGLGTHFVERSALAGLAEALASEGLGALAGVAKAAPPGSLGELGPRVAAAFGRASVTGIFAALERDGGAWAQSAAEAMRAASPSALLWTFDLLAAGAHRTLGQCQHAELALVRRATRHPDFAEGVRAMVVDKDRRPRWSPVLPDAA